MAFDFGFNFNFNFAGAVQNKKINYLGFVGGSGYPSPYPKQIEMFNFAFNNSVPRMILGARGYGKTDYITILGLAYEIYLDPNYTAILITKESERGKELVAEIKEILTRFGVRFKNKAKKKIVVEGCNGKEPNLIALTIRSKGLRGRHPTIVIMDDPITPEDDSQAERLRAKKCYEELLKLTQNLLIIGQPVHKLDLYQELRTKILTICVIYGDIPQLDKDLNALRASGVSEASISASYYLKILDDNSLPLASIKEVDYCARRNFAWIDPSHKGGDYTAIAIGGRNAGEFIIAGFAFKKAWYDCVEEFKYLFDGLNVIGACIETNGLGELPLRELRKIGLPCEGYNSTEPKHERIINMATFCDDLRLFRVDGGIRSDIIEANQIFIEQTKNYEYNAEHDDAPDACAGLINYVRGL